MGAGGGAGEGCSGPLSPTRTRALLEALGHRPRKPLGQNFLVDGNIVRKSLRLAGLQAGDTVVEIGPGLGTLTGALLESGCTVHAVELDPVLAAHLRASLGERFRGRFHLLEGDAVAHPRAGMPPAVRSFKVVANLPYAITSPWLEALLEEPLPQAMVLMLQREAAERLTAQPGSKAYGAVTVFLAAAYERAGAHKVSRSCFFPVPGVDSVLLHLRRKDRPVLFGAAARALIRELFTRRRKQIGSLLQPHPECAPWLARLDAFGCSRASRPEAIPVAAWLALDALLRQVVKTG